MLNANAVLMNQIASEASEAAQRRINSLEEEGIELPLGAALGASAFAGAGPKIHFRILPVGTVLTSFVTEFESAGINQTRHKIILEATATVRIVVPGGTPPPHSQRVRDGADGGEHPGRRCARFLYPGG